MEKVSVIILNWNGEKMLRDFLPSVVKYTKPALAKIIVADNHSKDNSIHILHTEFPSVKILQFDENHGYAGGYNLALNMVETEYVVLLNSDVAVSENWLEPLIHVLDTEQDVVAVQPKICSYVKPSYFEYAGACGGFVDRLGFPFCRGRIMDITEEDCGQYDNSESVFWCSGAALCVRRNIYLKMGGLDERFFAHMEEIDLCWRMNNMGWKLKAVPQSVIYHLGGGSLPMNHPHKLYLNYRNNLLMLYKNLSRGHWRKVIFQRVFIDMAASMMFLLKGEWKNFCSVYSAYGSFLKMRRFYIHPQDDKSNLLLYPCLIILKYYLRRIHKFSDLNYHING